MQPPILGIAIADGGGSSPVGTDAAAFQLLVSRSRRRLAVASAWAERRSPRGRNAVCCLGNEKIWAPRMVTAETQLRRQPHCRGEHGRVRPGQIGAAATNASKGCDLGGLGAEQSSSR